MASLSRDRVKEIIQNAPAGVSGEDIINQLVSNGNTLEGYEPPQTAPAKDSLTSKAINYIGEEGPSAIGAMAGEAISAPLALASGPLAPAVAASGAAIGAMGMRGIQRSAQYALGQREIPSVNDAITDIKSAGIGGAAGSLGGRIIGNAAGMAAPTVKKIGAQVIGGLTGLRNNVVEPVLNNLGSLFGSKPQGAVSGAYKAFEGYTGLQGIQAQEVATQEIPSAMDMIKNVFKTGQRVVSGEQVPQQELYTASQQASMLKRMAKFQNPPPEVLPRTAAIEQGKGIIDKALGEQLPEYLPLRKDAAIARANEQFNSPFPLKRNLSPDALRMGAQIGITANDLAEGAPLKALGTFGLMSPLAWKKWLQATYIVGKAATSQPGQFVGRVGAQSLADAYLGQK